MSPRGFHHVTVLRDESVDALVTDPRGTYVDATAGGAGHSLAVLERLGAGGRLIALDRDPSAVAVATARLEAARGARQEEDRPAVEIVHAPFADLDAVLRLRGLVPGGIQGVLADLGVSSPQLDEPGRGFSFRLDGPLDMRMDTSRGPTAAELVASADEVELARILYVHGDERDSRRIARAIVARRVEQPFERTADLASVIASAKPRASKKYGIHPATRSFQALRIAVNGEHEQLEQLIEQAWRWIAPGGRLCIVTFHSGEDRVVKQTFADWARGPELPVAQAVFSRYGEPTARLPHPKGISPSDAEIAANPRARSARLRVAEVLS